MKMLFDARPEGARRRATAVLALAALTLTTFVATYSEQASATAVRPVGGPTADWALTWADEFNAGSLDTSTWQTAEPWDTNGFTHEDAYFPQPPGELVSVENGSLHIRTRNQPNPAGKSMVSGMVTTRGSYSFTTGYLETRVKIPTGRSLWPAFWLLGNGTGAEGWPLTGELDIFEFVNNGREDGIPFMTTHWSGDGTTSNHAQRTYQWPAKLTDLEDRWVTFGLHRTPTSATVYIDGVLAHSLSVADGIPATPVFTDPMHVRFETQVGGGWARDASGYDEGDFVIDYVRAWGPATTTPTTAAPEEPTTTVAPETTPTTVEPTPTTAPPSTTEPAPEPEPEPEAERSTSTVVELDSFSGSSLDRTVWQSKSGSVAVHGGDLEMKARKGYSSVTGRSPLDLRSGGAQVEVAQATTSSSGETFLTVRGTGGDEVAMVKSGANLLLRHRVEGTYGFAGTVRYDAGDHRFWRVATEGGQITWSASADGATWTVLGTAERSVDLSGADVQLRTGDYRGRWNPVTAFDDVVVFTTAG